MLALNLVALRRRGGNLYTSLGVRGAVREVLDEVWDLIRAEMVAELNLPRKQGELLELARSMCDDCHDACHAKGKWESGDYPPSTS